MAKKQKPPDVFVITRIPVSWDLYVVQNLTSKSSYVVSRSVCNCRGREFSPACKHEQAVKDWLRCAQEEQARAVGGV